MLLLGGHYPTIGVVNARKWHSLKDSTGGSQGPSCSWPSFTARLCGGPRPLRGNETKGGWVCQRGKMLSFCHSLALGLTLEASVCRRTYLWLGMFLWWSKKKGYNYIILWIRGVVGESDGSACNPAISRNGYNGVLHTRSMPQHGKYFWFIGTLSQALTMIPKSQKQVWLLAHDEWSKAGCHFLWQNPS